MSSLKSLTFAAVPVVNSSPILARRARLIERLEEQKSLLKDPNYVRMVQRWMKRDGEKVLTEKRLRVRPWWRMDEKGQVVLFIRIGWKTVEFEKGKAGIVAGSKERLPEVIDVLIGAIRAGELDPMLEHSKDPRPLPKKNTGSQGRVPI
jgi:hypothetical protein